ncbi:MAG TPA: CHASE2 domain-containing protein [Terriglobales bacterium]|nr:CHASE2 domain-containing protein [Terriglobales bacterium]
MRKSATVRHGWGQLCGLGLGLFLAVSVLSTVSLLRDGQARFTDTFFRLAPAPNARSQVVLVTIDDESLQRFGRWPWSRTLLAKLTNNLRQAGAGAVGLDILLAEPQSPEADKSLREALQAAHAVIVDKIASFPEGPRWVEPLPQFAQAAGAVGHAQAPLDVDSVCRRFPPRELTMDGSRWAFAVEVARRIDARQASAFLSSIGIPDRDEAQPVLLAKPVLVRIPFRRGGFDTVSASAVLQGIDPSYFGGRPVLVGFGSTELGDRLSIPLHPEFPTSGVEVHAQILDGILSGRSLHDVPVWAAAVAVLFTCLVSVGVFRSWKGLAAVGVFAVTAVAVTAVALLAFTVAGRVLPAGSMLLAVILAPLLVYTADFVQVERSINQQLLGLRTWLAWHGKQPGTTEREDFSWRLELLQQLQTELGSLYELHKTLLESTQDLVAIFDDRGDLLLRNRAFAEAFGLAPESRLTLVEVRSRWSVSTDAPLVQSGPIEEGEVSLGGELYAARISPLPPTRLSPEGGAVLRLSNLRTRVERDRARAEALGFITHELRTPLASIQGFAELMINYPESPVRAAAPETIFRESKRLLALISSYLDVLRLDAGAKAVAKERVELEGVVQHVFDILGPLASAAGMQLIFEGSNVGAVLGDAPLISGALLNLVSNAIKYGQVGSDIRVRCIRSDNEVSIGVHNEGKPTLPEEIERLFDPFYRASNTEKGKSGWGLGLAFVKRIAEKHGGSVSAQSQQSGMVFEIRLPVSPEPVLVAKEVR